MSLFDEYAAIVAKYSELYGREKTVVLIEVGSFMEWYNDDANAGVNVKRVCDILNVQATRKNKSITTVSRQNPELGGIPKHAMSKYLPLLIDADMTVVIVSQTTPPPNPKRQVTEVISKATLMDDSELLRDTSVQQGGRRKVMASVFVEFDKRGQLAAFGFATLDAWTGESTAYNSSNKTNDEGVLWDDMRRVIVQSSAVELVVCGVDAHDSWTIGDFESRAMHGAQPCMIHDWLCGRREYCRKLTWATFQNSVLASVFKETGMLSPAEHCELERMPSALACYTSLVDFAYRHNEPIVHRITPPTIIHASDRLVLAHNALIQLDVVPKNVKDSKFALVNMLNTAVTPHGRRLFQKSLVDPMSDAREIQRRLDCISCLVNNPSVVDDVRTSLSQAYDVERLCRKVSVLRISPKELGMLVDSVVACLSMRDVVVRLMDQHPILPSTTSIVFESSTQLFDDLDAFMRYVNETMDCMQLARCHTTSATEAISTGNNIFKPGYCKELDSIFDQYASSKRVFEDVTNALNRMHTQLGCSHPFKLCTDDSTSEMSIQVTARRFSAAMANAMKWPASASVIMIAKYDDDDDRILHNQLTSECVSGSSNQTATVRIVHPILTRSNARAMSAARSLSIKLQATFLEVCGRIGREFGSCLKLCSNVLAWMDWYASCARNAMTLRHNKPTVIEANCQHSSSSYINVRGLRHPIIEALNDKVPHVPNDVALGAEEEQDGVLLYGINAAGKSSLMKAVGIAVLMAQSGMYVAADDMTIRPYHTLMTRIQSGDNIFTGQSTFMAEMQEVRTMLKRCDAHSLMLGDEICAGTESLSATAIVGATLQTLVQRKASFVFATHLHELCDLDIFKKPGSIMSERVNVSHMAVRVDPDTHALVYERRLSRGSGPRLYGLEVCEALGMDGEFMQRASAIRHEVLERPIDSPVCSNGSRYSSKLMMSLCAVCGKSNAQDVHHIKHQAWADEDGFIGTEHKNRLSNLVPICEACHDKAHHGSLNVQGYIQTSHGVRLQQTSGAEDNDKDNNNDSTKESMGRDICKMRGFGFSYKKIANVINARYGTRHSVYTVQRIYNTAQTVKDVDVRM